MVRRAALAILVVLPTAALADRREADACAASLPVEAKLIYDAALPSITPSAVIRDILPDKVRPLVMAGKVSRNTGRASAEAAGQCLKYLK
jgi:hypothetical protein